MRCRLRTPPLIVAGTLLVGVVVELYRLSQVILEGRSQKLPPTMYSEHTGFALALAFVAMIFVLMAVRRDASIPTR